MVINLEYDNNNDDYSTIEPTEVYYITTNYPSYNKIQSIKYTCICKNKNDYKNEKKITILISIVSITTFMCIALTFYIIWYRFFFKRKLMNKHQNNRLFLENFGIEFSQTNNI